MSRNRTILLEFNELTPALIDRFVDAGELPNFARFRSQSRTFMTHAEEEHPNLEPWIQWVTVHTGLNYSDHGVFHLNEGHTLDAKRIWDVVSDHGMNVWVCGSMNVRYDSGLRGGVVPDPWCTKVEPTPRELGLYFRFVQQNVLEHTNEKLPLSRSDYLQFLTFMVTHGLSAASVSQIARQLASERWSDSKWKRVVLLDLLQLDVFTHYYRKFAPAFSTFFLNSTAHYQHAYWDSMEPEVFGRVATPEASTHKDAVLFGYQRMDAILGRFMRLAGDDVTLIFSTALSQEPWLGHESDGAGMFYRPKSFEQVLATIGVSDILTVAPVMTEQFHLEFQTPAAAEKAEHTLRSLTLDGTRLIGTQRDGARLFAGCNLHEMVADDALIALGPGRASVPFHSLFYRVQTAKTAMHNPEGALWVRTPERTHVETRSAIPLASVAPSILKAFGIAAPAHMRSPAISLA